MERAVQRLKSGQGHNELMPQYIYALDKKIKRRVVHVIVGEWAISLVTRSKFKYKPKKHAH